jgi:hypothetical protein
MSKVIGAASEFYRLRVSRLDATDEPDLEWRDDILYRKPPKDAPEEIEDWLLEAVSLDEDETAYLIARFAEADQAHALMETVQIDLDTTTRSDFEDQYLTEDTAPDSEG